MMSDSSKMDEKSAQPVVEVDDDMSDSDEQIVLPGVLPVLTSADLTPFPAVMMALYVETPLGQNAVEKAVSEDGIVLVVAQKEREVLEPGAKDLYRIGVAAKIVKDFSLNDGRTKVLLQGLARVKVEEFRYLDSNPQAKIEAILEPDFEVQEEHLLLVESIRANLQTLVEYEHLPEEMLLVVEEIEDVGILTDVIIAHYKLDVPSAQSMLEELDAIKRLEFTEKIIADDLNQFLISENIRDRAVSELSKGQREYYLREQLRQIQSELGEVDDNSDDLGELRKSLSKEKLTEPARKEAEKQFSRLERMHAESSEYAMLRTYLEWVADLPWKKRTRDRLDLKKAQKLLDSDHFGLDKAKERILEFLSVRKLKKDSTGPILCFVGPPGVGKTSLGRSIARCLNRKFFRMSLGGVRDEAEIRGHRRTYVGALPGRIVQGLKESESSNPVVLLDELDKVGADFRGDPAAALLEILDPHQNKDFRDHYLNIPFDLSGCLFIATANMTDTIPEALLDRLETIYISGYTAEEKLHIAKSYLIPRQVEEQGLKSRGVSFTDEAIMVVIERFTREAGVRNLERQIAALCRKIARELVEKGKIKKKVTGERVVDLLGVERYLVDEVSRDDTVGLVRGLAWTSHGGEVLQIETSVANGKGGLSLTGQLGDVMQESAKAAMFFARANAHRLGIDENFSSKTDVHIHVPNGATPKDGPSAGITIVTALVSALTGRKIRASLAMTGEVTLLGAVLPVGGIKEKALAALRHDLRTVIIPKANLKDLEEIPKEQRALIEFIPVESVVEVLNIALLPLEKQTKKRSGKKGRQVKPTIIV